MPLFTVSSKIVRSRGRCWFEHAIFFLKRTSVINSARRMFAPSFPGSAAARILVHQGVSIFLSSSNVLTTLWGLEGNQMHVSRSTYWGTQGQGMDSS
jgi:hypothetical protein